MDKAVPDIHCMSLKMQYLYKYTSYTSYLYKFGLLVYVIVDSIFKYILRLKLLKFICSAQLVSF